jgi:hypothetical protein
MDGKLTEEGFPEGCPLDDYNEWIKVEDRLPDKNTKYAARYGVSVLVYDEKEKGDSGHFTPSDASFNFKNNRFEVLAHGPKGTEWLHAFWVTHWKELPNGPKSSD